jgi:hypothetical protein
MIRYSANQCFGRCEAKRQTAGHAENVLAGSIRNRLGCLQGIGAIFGTGRRTSFFFRPPIGLASEFCDSLCEEAVKFALSSTTSNAVFLLRIQGARLGVKRPNYESRRICQTVAFGSFWAG